MVNFGNRIIRAAKLDVELYEEDEEEMRKNSREIVENLVKTQ